MHAQVAPEENRLLRSIPAARVALIERITRAASGARSRLTQGLLRTYFRGVAEDDLGAREPAQLARAALAHLALATRRAPGRTLVRVFNPDAGVDGFESAHTLVLTVTDDMPFLVDSISMALGRAEVAVHLIVHPVLRVRRDGRGRLIDIGANGKHRAHAESWQLFEIDHIGDPARLAALQQDIEATLADVRISVTDWAAMRARMRAVIGALENDPPALPATEVSEARALLDWMEAQHFVFLGYRRYRLVRGSREDRLVPDRRSGLGILSDYPHQRPQPLHTSVMRGDLRARARAAELLVITKANSTATVHRGEYLDYVGIKTFDSRGRVDGEHRFLGL
ncbi:MAG: NAD-glutamate dehydrogenase, partial [Steroidobacterales bacterium]